MVLRHVPLRRTSTGQFEPTSWDVMASGCSLLHQAVLHEAEHAFGFSGEHSRLSNTVMYASISGSDGPYCSPQKHDVVGIMANYQSR